MQKVVPKGLKIYAKNLEMIAQARGYIQKKFQRLERHLNTISDAKLEVSRMSSRSQNDRVVAQMTLTASDHTLRGQESGPNLFAAIDSVTDVMDRKIQKYKGRVYNADTSEYNVVYRRQTGDYGVIEPELV